MKPLPEFNVALTRVAQGETANSPGEQSPHQERKGRRTKLGGIPDWDQTSDVPTCEGCGKPLTFVAQIDSLEHDLETNPLRVAAGSKEQRWMFGDVGMIYVFFCFECLESQSLFQSG